MRIKSVAKALFYEASVPEFFTSLMILLSVQKS